MVKAPTSRISSIDLLRGLVMVLMALDHSRAFVFFGEGSDPTNLETTTPLLYFTRIITHLCAPVFVALAGSSAYLYGQGKPKAQLSRFLFTRGLWLIFAEATILSFAWTFDLTHSYIYFGVMWAIGFAMVVMAGLIYLPLWSLVGLGLLFVAGHNALDGYAFAETNFAERLGRFLLRPHTLDFGFTRLRLSYTPLPWLGCMLLGYGLGALYTLDVDRARRRLWLLGLGISALLVFFLLRPLNLYGDPRPWAAQGDVVTTLMAFFDVSKYPPSLLFFSLTLGIAGLLLIWAERWRGAFTRVLLVFGRVPFFFYVLHLYLLHIIKLLMLHFREKWGPGELLANDQAAGFPLYAVYIVWVLALLLLYPPSRWYMRYKARNRDKWWLSYL